MSVGVKSVFKKSPPAPYPLIVNFQNGKLQEEGRHDIQGGLYYSNDHKCNAIAVFGFSNMLYVGEEAIDSQGDTSHNLIVTRNKKTGDISLYEVGNLFVKALSEVEQIQIKQEEKPKDEPDHRYQLGEAFGSKRRKRVLEQSKKLKVDIDTMKEQLEKTVKEKQFDAKEVSQLNVEPELERDQYAPPCNRAAEDVKDVYNIGDLISQEQMDALRETADNVLQTDNFHEFVEVTEYIKGYIINLKTSSVSDKVDKCCFLLYTDCLIRYLSDPYKRVTSLRYEVCSYSESINKAVLNNFSVFSDKGRTRPNHLKDKAVCYTIVLLLLYNNNLIKDVSALSKAISTPVSRLSQMVKVVGAHYSGVKGSNIVLKLPLSAPPVMKRKRY